jgi:hypothetical protein
LQIKLAVIFRRLSTGFLDVPLDAFSEFWGKRFAPSELFKHGTYSSFQSAHALLPSRQVAVRAKMTCF